MKGPEDEVQAKCDDLAKTLGYEVVNLSQKRRSGVHEGLPDRYYRHSRGIRLWWETKPPKGKLSVKQHAFLLAELRADGLACCGDEVDLRVILELAANAMSFVHTRRRCHDIVAVWAAKGYRRTKP